MNIRNELAAIVERLEAIEKAFNHYATAIRTTQEYERKNPPSIRAEITFDDASKRDAQAEANRQNCTQAKIARYAFCAFLAAIFYAGISGLQLYEMRIQTQASFKQFETENADASVKAVQWLAQLKVAQNQAIAAQEGITAIQRQMRQDQRAWINIGFGKLHWNANETIGVAVTWINTGKTPAKDFSGRAIVEKVSIGQVPHFDDNQYPANKFGGGLLIPNAPESTFGFQSMRDKPNTKEIEPLIISAEDSREIQDGRAYAVVHGIIRYRDIFDTPHWLRFCKYSGGNILTIQDFIKSCTDYNRTDEN